ncbi:hypothetical protein C2R22_19355 [Salinigranum rubrum]|uniref:Twitching motility protein PilT n=1 Tax=Salinigranum rubrum TaxID=755307 RepID=A0A2I8VNP4_9EURY|nr:hypothetical protein [Salinigranum rubrum]AUV83533.1 hypothetical protein C2R22_19355 [Salinigranum rubrum]
MTADSESRASYDRLYLDATVLANLAVADLVGVVPETVDNPRTSYAVRAELDAGVVAGFEPLTRALAGLSDPLDESSTGDITVAGSLVRQRKPEFLDRLSRSEASVLYQAWAAGVPLATDDRDVRAVAATYGVPTTGSVGLVARAVERGVLSVEAADGALATWRDAGVSVPVDSVRELTTDDTD